MLLKDTRLYRAIGETLLWVGSRDIRHFQPIFDHCLQQASQVAVRPTIDQAVRRPADRVGGIIIACANRAPLNEVLASELLSHHDCPAIQLIGPLFAGDRRNMLAIPRVYWHQWRRGIEQLLCPHDRSTSVVSPLPSKTVAVVAATADNAEPLMDLATSSSAAAVWCRRAETFHARNFDVVWWDDSVAGPEHEFQWRHRIQASERYCNAKPTHVWLTNLPRVESVQAARLAGVDFVLSKPFQIEELLATLDGNKLSSDSCGTANARAA